MSGLRESNRHHVWQDDLFHVSRAADALVGATQRLSFMIFLSAASTLIAVIGGHA
jgi:hypothetical protein